LFGVVFWLDHCFAVFFVDVDLCSRGDTETLPHLFRKDDSSF